ncbi:MAG TPA: hypothetical protein PLG88_05620 [Chitinophagaceae bacterium]|nr:hypothetical protein [Chitinophagaceae bacterium]
MMRCCFSIFILLIGLSAFGQRIDFRNDSLFINHQYVDNHTPKSTLDQLMGMVGKEKTSAGKQVKNKIFYTFYIYKKLGVKFFKKNTDSSHLSVGIKFYKNTDGSFSKNLHLKTFKGEMYIDGNYMNERRSIAQLENTTSWFVFYRTSRFMGEDFILYATLHYGKREIRALFDRIKKLMNCIYII